MKKININQIKERFLSLNNFYQRLITALVLAPTVLLIVWVGGVTFKIMVGAAAFIMLMEWLNMTRNAEPKALLSVVGLTYIILPCLSFIFIREYLDGGVAVCFFLFFVVWATDIGAYAFGKLIGGPKLAPMISPKKTWAGFFGGILCAVTITLIIANEPLYPFFAAALSVTGQIGDLFESWLKRIFGVKDSGQMLPGHGGLLDRLDSFLFVSLAAGIYLFIASMY